MILSRKDTFTPGAKRSRVKAAITTNHPASLYGLPVIILEDGKALDAMSWISLD